MKKEVRVLFFPVGGAPELRYIESDLAGMQAAIDGGFIECLGLTEDLDLFCDEEGRLKELPFNCFLQRPGEAGVHEIFGPMFIVGHDGEGEAKSITPEQAATIRTGHVGGPTPAGDTITFAFNKEHKVQVRVVMVTP